jgi:hypothetical protein
MKVSKAGEASRKEIREQKSKSWKFGACKIISKCFSCRNLPKAVGILIV